MGDICLVSERATVRSDELPGRQGRLAAAFLLSERKRPVTRGAVAEVLWPGALPERYDVGLSAIVSKLRAALARLGLDRDALNVADGCYQLRLPADSWVDVDAAIEGVHLAEGALLSQRYPAAYGPAVVAAAILRRPFLAGFEGPWIDSTRDRLRAAHVRALDCLAEVHEWNGEHALALRAANEAVEVEPYRESGYRRLMGLHERAGNPAEALRVYERLSSLLRRELRSTPGPETRLLSKRIQNVVKN